MKNSNCKVDGHLGSIFEGEAPDTYCFVPQECIFVDCQGLHVDEIAYVQSGWHVRNMRLNDTSFGQHLFPKALCPVDDLDDQCAVRFLDRLKIIHCA